MTAERRRVVRKDAGAAKKAVLKKSASPAKRNVSVRGVGDAFAEMVVNGTPAAKSPGEEVEQKKNIMELKKPIQAALELRPAIAARRAQNVTTEELVAPEEWEALLNSFEYDSDSSVAFMAAPKDAPGNDDELWERLSSTRWIHEQRQDMPSEEMSNRSTVANRPA